MAILHLERDSRVPLGHHHISHTNTHSQNLHRSRYMEYVRIHPKVGTHVGFVVDGAGPWSLRLAVFVSVFGGHTGNETSHRTTYTQRKSPIIIKHDHHHCHHQQAQADSVAASERQQWQRLNNI